MTLVVNGLFPGEIKPDATIGGCIEIFENLWPNPAETIQALESECANPDSACSWNKASTVGLGAVQDIRTNREIAVSDLAFIENNKTMQNIHNQYHMLLLAATNSYASRFGIQEPLFHEPYSALKYSNGTQYHAHYDGPTGMGRAISAICYLNDNYEGGELEFPNFKIRIKPQAGMLMLWPSNYAYMHTALPVTHGVKYALVTWIRDREL